MVTRKTVSYSLPVETVEIIKAYQETHGLPSASAALNIIVNAHHGRNQKLARAIEKGGINALIAIENAYDNAGSE